MKTLGNQKTKNLSVELPPEACAFEYIKGKQGVFFIHGFTDSLCRVNDFAEFLAEKGISAKGIVLPGHCRSWEELEATTPADWYAAVEKGIKEFAETCDEVYLLGISFGGNLALKFAAAHPKKIKGIVTIETPMHIKNQGWIKLGIPLARIVGLRYWDKAGYYRNVDHPDKASIYKKGVLDKMPLTNIKQVIHFLEREQIWLPKVKTDILIIESEKSNVITESSAEKISDQVGSKRKEIMRIKNVYHSFLSQKSREFIFNKATDFFGLKVR